MELISEYLKRFDIAKQTFFAILPRRQIEDITRYVIQNSLFGSDICACDGEVSFKFFYYDVNIEIFPQNSLWTFFVFIYAYSTEQYDSFNTLIDVLNFIERSCPIWC